VFQQASAGAHTAHSAGTTPAEHLHPEVVEVMRELGIDLARRQPQLLTRELAQQADVVVTMGSGDQGPSIPGKRYIDGDLPDPKGRECWSAPDVVTARVSTATAGGRIGSAILSLFGATG
jgi:arsenate reductase (thioredoxin)